MRPDGQDVGGAVREPHPAAAVRELHQAPRELAHRVRHRLVRGGDPARRGEVVHAQVDARAPAVARVEKGRERRAAVGPEERLRRLDHHLEAERRGRKAVARLEPLEPANERPRLLGHVHLRQRDDEALGHRALALFEHGAHEDLERPAGSGGRLAQRLDPDPREGRRGPLGDRAPEVARRPLRRSDLPRRRAARRTRPRSRSAGPRPARAAAWRAPARTRPTPAPGRPAGRRRARARPRPARSATCCGARSRRSARPSLPGTTAPRRTPCARADVLAARPDSSPRTQGWPCAATRARGRLHRRGSSGLLRDSPRLELRLWAVSSRDRSNTRTG